MTKDELFEKFWDHAEWHTKSDARLYRLSFERAFRESFYKIVVPHLAIPRSLRDDPPTKGQIVIVLTAGIIASGPVIFDSRYKHANTHWIPFPELPKIDKDEQEFEEWFSSQERCYLVAKELELKVWMAARGRK